MMKWMLCALVVAGCARSTDGANGGGGGGGGADMAAVGGNGAGGDLGGNSGGEDLAPSGAQDLATATQDFAQPVADLAQPSADLAQPPADMATGSGSATVHILIDNFCNSSTNPTVINAPHGPALMLTFINDSHDYHADVWSSRGYGFLDMPEGYVWNDPVQHCTGPNPYTEYFDVGIQGGPVGGSCPNYRLQIHCN